jgi:hypothetical protein
MNHDAVNAVFRPALTKMETKADISARVARQIIDTEVAKRNAKTERLKAARLEMEAIEAGKPIRESEMTDGANQRRFSSSVTFISGLSAGSSPFSWG